MMVTRRLKDLGTFKTGLTYSPDNLCEENNGVLVLRSSNIKEGKLSFIDNVYVDLSLSNKMLVKKGDIIICSRNGSANLVGKTAVIDSDIVASWGAFMMLFRTKHNSRYLNYLLNVYITKNKGLFATSTINQLTNSMLGNIYVDFVENINEQDKIADYLDEKTKAIDTRISMLEKKSEAYKRLKASVINRAVTRGLNPDVTVRDSGIEWIGMIPEHWEIKRYKEFITLQKGKTPKELSYESVGLPYLTMDYLRDRDGKSTVYPESVEGLLEISANEIIVLWDGANAGEFIKSKAGYLGSTMALLLTKGISKNYLYYFLKSIERDSKYYSNGTTIPHFDSGILLNREYPVPPYSEQQAIANYLDAKCSEIDKAIENIDKQIDALNRLKRSLINEAVTGQRKV